MALKVIHSTINCAESTCPTIYQDDQGNFVIQGFILKNEIKKSINIPEGEDAIKVPAEFIETFIAKMKV